MVIVRYTKETYEEAKQVQRVLEQSKIPSRMEACSESGAKDIDVFVTKDSLSFDDRRWYCAKLNPAVAKRLLASLRPVSYRPFDSAYAASFSVRRMISRKYLKFLKIVIPFWNIRFLILIGMFA